MFRISTRRANSLPAALALAFAVTFAAESGVHAVPSERNVIAMQNAAPEALQVLAVERSSKTVYTPPYSPRPENRPPRRSR